MTSLPALILSAVMLIGFPPWTTQNRRPITPFLSEKPIDCETFAAQLDISIIEWRELKDTRMIFIARLGTGERDRKINRGRHEWLEEYLQKKGVAYVFAEGDRVKGLGRMEVYVGGRLVMSAPTKRGVRRLCFGDLAF